MRSWGRRLRGAFARNRYDVLAWALAASVTAAGAATAILIGMPVLAIFTTAVAGALRLGLEIGRRERNAPIEQRLRERAGVTVAAAADRLLERTLWHDQKASEALRRAFIDMRMGGTGQGIIPFIPGSSWSLDDAVTAGAEAFNIRRHEAGDWLGVEAELQRAHDDFAGAVGPYGADLDAQARQSVSDCLAALEDAKQAAAGAFQVLYAPGKPQDEIERAASGLFVSLQKAQSAARRLADGERA